MPGIASADLLLGVMAIRTAMTSTIQPMSGMRLSVAMISSHQKKLNLKSLTTQEFMKISNVKNKNDKLRPA